MSNYQVDICHIHTKSLKNLDSNQTIELLKKYHFTKNPLLREQIVMGNLKLVLSIVSKYRQDELDDLFQVGCVGLLKAIDQFDLKQNVMFSTYAVPVIIGEIKAYIRNKSLLHVSRNIRDLSLRVSKYKEAYIKEHMKDISKKELMEKLNLTNFELYQIENLNNHPYSLSDEKNGQDGILLIEAIEDKKMSLKGIHDHLCLEKAMSSLNKKDRWLIIERYYNDRTQSEIAKELALSQAQISRYEKKILNQLKDFFI